MTDKVRKDAEAILSSIPFNWTDIKNLIPHDGGNNPNDDLDFKGNVFKEGDHALMFYTRKETESGSFGCSRFLLPVPLTSKEGVRSERQTKRLGVEIAKLIKKFVEEGIVDCSGFELVRVDVWHFKRIKRTYLDEHYNVDGERFLNTALPKYSNYLEKAIGVFSFGPGEREVRKRFTDWSRLRDSDQFFNRKQWRGNHRYFMSVQKSAAFDTPENKGVNRGTFCSVTTEGKTPRQIEKSFKSAVRKAIKRHQTAGVVNLKLTKTGPPSDGEEKGITFIDVWNSGLPEVEFFDNWAYYKAQDSQLTEW